LQKEAEEDLEMLHFGGTHVVTYPEERCGMFLLNLCVNVPTYRASQPKDCNLVNEGRKIDEKIIRMRGQSKGERGKMTFGRQ
jgi:D-tyrosyl-tRNA(Tyr) deacylase